MDLFITLYLSINLFIMFLGGTIYPAVTFYKANKMGLDPPTPFNLTQAVDFWKFIDQKGKTEEYRALRIYILIPRFVGVINIAIGSILIIYYWEIVLAFIGRYVKERSLF